MKKKIFDCIDMQRRIRDKLLAEANYDLHTLILQVRENNKKSRFYKILSDRKEQEKQTATA